MTMIAEDDEREDRIAMEVVVDAYDAEEQAMGWYAYLEDKLTFPFEARCIQARSLSPLRVGETVVVESLAAADDCQQEMFVLAHWQGRALGLPLIQLVAVEADAATVEAISDWHYWLGRGYSFD